MDCFLDYIGIKGCGAPVPDSGVYINDLPGVTLENIERIADAEQETFLGVWKDVQALGVRQFGRKLLFAFRNRWKEACCKEGCDPEELICREDVIPLFTDALLYYLGAQLMTERLYSIRLNRFTTIDREQAAELRDYFMAEMEEPFKIASVQCCVHPIN